MIDPLSAIYLAIGILIGFSVAFVFFAREPADYPALRKYERIAPEAKVVPLHVLNRIGTVAPPIRWCALCHAPPEKQPGTIDGEPCPTCGDFA